MKMMVAITIGSTSNTKACSRTWQPGLAHLEVSLPSTDRFTQTMGLLSIMTRKV